MILPSEIVPRTVEVVHVQGGAGTLTERSVSYLLEVRGPLIEADLAAISSDGLCQSKFSGSTECYLFASNMPDTTSGFSDLEEGEGEGEEEDEILQLESELNVTKHKLEDKGVVIPAKTKVSSEEAPQGEVEGSAQETPSTSQDEEADPPDTLGVVELVFEDKELPSQVVPPDSEDVDEVAAQYTEGDSEGSSEDSEGHYINSDGEAEGSSDDDGPSGLPSSMVQSTKSRESSSHLRESEDGGAVASSESEDGDVVSSSESETESEDQTASSAQAKRTTRTVKHPKTRPLERSASASEEIRMAHRSNHIDVEELDINLGIIYIVTDVNDLHRKFETYERDALSVYEQIDDNEKDMRNDRTGEIKKQLNLAGEHLELRVREIQTDETGMRYQLLRLTALLQDAENLRGKAQQRSTGSTGSTGITINPEVLEIDRVYNRTRKTVHEMNISLLRQRDEVEDILTNFEESLKELFEL